MNMKDLTLFVILAVLLGGFYLILNNVSQLSDDVRSMEIAMHFFGQNNGGVDSIISEGQKKSVVLTSSTSTSVGLATDDIITIPTAIIFQIVSSPLLQPQTNIPIIAESVSKKRDGQISVNVKAFTSEAEAYSAIELRDLFELIDLQGENQKPLQVTGGFSSIPPKSVVNGGIIFKIKPEQKTMILQIDMGGDRVKYYEFNFEKKTYKETVIG